MRRKHPITLNLPERVRTLATEYAEANGRSLSSLIEYLLREHMEENGVPINLSPEEFAKHMESKFGVKLTPGAPAKKGAKKKGGDVEL